MNTCLKVEYKITSNFRLDYEFLKMDARTGGKASAMLIFRNQKFLGSTPSNPLQSLCLIYLGIPETNYEILIVSIRKNATIFSRTIIIPYQEFILSSASLPSLCVSL